MAYFNFTNNTINLTSVEESDDSVLISFYFVVKDANQMTESMKLAHEATKERFQDPESVNVISEVEMLNMPKAKLKEDRKIFVFDDFDKKNDAFNYVFTAQTVYILGTKALLTIVLDQVPLPTGMNHIHNLAMRELVICATFMERSAKANIKELVNFMGGNYTDALKEAVTHLVSGGVHSDKYVAAAKNNVSIMHPDWVTNVWKKTQSGNEKVIASDESFNRFKLPIFYNLCITSTGLSLQDRNNIKTQVEGSGGAYSAAYNKKVDILIMEKEHIGCEKFKAAMKMKKTCLTPAWITQSIQIGSAAPFDDFKIVEPKSAVAIKASTPTKYSNITVSKFNPDSTALSEISQITVCGANCSNINETLLSNAPRTSTRLTMATNTQLVEYRKILGAITLQDVKKCGILLDGFTFFLSGFTAEELQFIGKVLSVLGGTKIDSVSEQMSHVIVGTNEPKLFQELDENNFEPVIVTIEWLQKVVEQRSIVDDTFYQIKRQIKTNPVISNPSPASKKAIKSLHGSFKKPMVSKLQLESRKKVEEEKEMELVNQYLNPPAIEINANTLTESGSQFLPFLTGKYVYVFGVDNREVVDIIDNCEELGATLVDASYSKEVDYAITDSKILPSIEPNIQFKHLVTDLWLVESLEAGKAIEVQFYHKPVARIDSQPLKGEMFVVTNYKGSERKYIKVMVESMGGTYSDVLKKADQAILITSSAEGKKFESAKTWNATVLTIDWLFECIAKKRRVDETHFLVGGTSASSKNIKLNDSIVLSSQDVSDFHDPPVENFADDVDDKFSTPNRTITAVPSRMVRSEGTPRTPGTPQLNDSRLIVDMPTPQREVTRAALLAARKPVVSPRKRRLEELVDTPTTRATNHAAEKSSPMPELPKCMKLPDMDYGIRPNSSPYSQWFHKRKMEGLDKNYVPRSPNKKSRFNEKVEIPTPYSHRRYDFFKTHVIGYNSPDPRKPEALDNEGTKSTSANDASRFLNLDDDEESTMKPTPMGNETEEAFKSLDELALQKSKEKPMKSVNMQKIFEDEMQKPEEKDEFMMPHLSEALVEWKDDNVPKPRPKNKKPLESDDVVYQGGFTSDLNNAQENNHHVFSLNGFDDNTKEVLTQEIEKLNGRCDNSNFTHLISAKPNRSEKFLMSLAGAKFIIHSEYIDECSRQGKFVDEAEYEFGNPKFAPALDDSVKNEKTFKMPYKWRKWIKSEHKARFEYGAFTGMAFIVAGSESKVSQFKNIIEAGGGKFLEVDFAKKLDPALIKRERVDYCLIEMSSYLSKENDEILKKCNVACDYIKLVASYLLSDEAPMKFM